MITKLGLAASLATLLIISERYAYFMKAPGQPPARIGAVR